MLAVGLYSLPHYVSGDVVRASQCVHFSLHYLKFISPTSAPYGIRSTLISLPCFRLFRSLHMPTINAYLMDFFLLVGRVDFKLNFNNIIIRSFAQDEFIAIPATRDNAPKTTYDFYACML